jgi:hypothetical protein
MSEASIPDRCGSQSGYAGARVGNRSRELGLPMAMARGVGRDLIEYFSLRRGRGLSI